MASIELSVEQKIAEELNVTVKQVNAAITLLDDGATVPFIARYRKEATQGLTDTHLRDLDQRLRYLRDLADRRKVILTSIEQQGKLTPALEKNIKQADNKTYLEDLYLPFKPKRRTKGEIAKQAGLSPLADKVFSNWQVSPEQEAQAFINTAAGFSTVEEVLAGVTSILAERFTEDAALLQKLRKHLLKQAHLTSRVVKSKQKDAGKFKDYFEHSELLRSVPSHRALAMLRGKNESVLKLALQVDPNQETNTASSAEAIIFEHYRLNLTAQAAAQFLTKTVHSAWKEKLSKSLETELLTRLREQAEVEAINVFSTNLFDVLMAAPAGAKTTLGLDPGLRTGCKLATVDATGKVLQTSTIFPHAPQNSWDKSVRTLTNLVQQHKIELIAIGNGTGSRESDQLVAEVIAIIGAEKLKKVMVSEAGASIYSASEYASNEFPDLDVSLRGAVSIARRLQDPLAELVKIDPKAIGVGQYQHDVSQSLLSQALDNVIEDCVNGVGVDLNSASAALLSRVAGLTKTMAQNIVNYRNEHGRFTNRKQLNKVPRVGPKAFEQAAGFLRISGGDDPLDHSGVHPESYAIVEQVLSALNEGDINTLIGNKDLLSKVNTSLLNDDSVGSLTLQDIVNELEKPGRDPRPEFKTATFKEGVNTVNDLEIGMILEGVISNVANFGAFVDVGVHQDGLVHISSITNKFISDPREIVKAGDVVKVKVTEVDAARKRISLTMRLDDDVTSKSQTPKPAHAPSKNAEHKSHAQKAKKSGGHKPNQAHKSREKKVGNAAMGNAFADAFAQLKK